eukprot:CAMPEP_0117442934 /NCGR_PEP_ID=MMETSP0759-20121206/4419_1 /TAXON_ID=63605 /ORGANISM="Percolomonas cosmopolitus, Strain WS" /LENGTH=463 /DNA_ID=CAMNT_0005234861 /DNA_START=101 /DNA_END=1492 /DNA_ORIENTATION=+
MEIPYQHTVPTSSYFDFKSVGNTLKSQSELELDQLPPRSLHATYSGGYMLVGHKGSLFGFGANHMGETATPQPYADHWMRPRFSLDPHTHQLVKLNWVKCGSVASFAYVTCWNLKEQREENVLCACGNSTDGMLGDLDTRTLNSPHQNTPTAAQERRRHRAHHMGINISQNSPTRNLSIKTFTPLHIPFKDPHNEQVLGVESQGTSTIVWTLRPDRTNGVYGTGTNMSFEMSTKRENLREFKDITDEFVRDYPNEDCRIVDIKKTLTTTHVLLSNGKLYARGRGRNSELGTGRLVETHLAEVDIPFASNERVERIFTGTHHVMALTKVRDARTGYELNRLFEWGAGNFPGKIIVGQRTDPNYTEPSPERFGIREITHHYFSREDPIVQVRCGSNMTYVITQSGKIYCAGSSSDGQLGVEYESPDAPTLGHYKNMVKFLVPEGEKIVDIACAQTSAVLWSREEV